MEEYVVVRVLLYLLGVVTLGDYVRRAWPRALAEIGEDEGPGKENEAECAVEIRDMWPGVGEEECAAAVDQTEEEGLEETPSQQDVATHVYCCLHLPEQVDAFDSTSNPQMYTRFGRFVHR
jgi:hypothetical protein